MNGTELVGRVVQGLARGYSTIVGTGASSQRLRLRTHCQGRGIEIGALHFPLPLPSGASVAYVDQLSVPEQRRHYPELEGQTLVPVSIIAKAEDLRPVATGSLDFIVANHLLEHCENPVRALAEFDRVLKKNGTVFLALPDPQHTFDRNRALTTTEHLLAEFRDGPEANRLAHYVDYAKNVDGRDEAHARALMDRRYSIHFHVWNPETFRAFFEAAQQEARLQLQIVDFDFGDNEFIYVLRKGSTRVDRVMGLAPSSTRLRAAARELRLAIKERS